MRPESPSDTTMFSCRCLRGRVKISARGRPLRTGICHCTDCRQESGSACTFYGIWPASEFETTGETSEFRGRRFCSHCGSRPFSLDDREAEIKRPHRALWPAAQV